MDAFTSDYWSKLNHRVSRRGVLRGAAITSSGLAAAALIGCGSDETSTPGGSDGTSSPTGTASATGTGDATGGAQSGGRLALTQAGDPPSFDLHKESTTYTNYVTSMSYNQLLRFDPLVGQETPESVIGDLATDWEISPDGQQYTFHLVDNATYHDGKPFTAADVKASYDRQQNPPEGLINPPRGAQIQWIDTMDTPDDHTLVLNMSRPVSSLSVLPIFAQSWMAIYSAEDIQGGFDFRGNVNGTGPFRMKSYDQGSKVVQDRFENYFVQGQPYVDGVDVYIIPDQSTAVANFQAGQLHVYSPNLEALNTILDSLGDSVNTETVQSYGFGTMNYGGREPWTDERVRQAVAMSFDKQAAIDVLLFGDGRYGGYMSGGGYWSLTEDQVRTLPGYEKFSDTRASEARKMLDAAGVPAKLDASILTRQGTTYENLSLYVQDQLSRVGINAQLDIQETASAYDLLAKRDFDLAPWSHAYAVDDPDAVFAEFYLTGSPRNYSQVSSTEVDDLYLKQSQEQDPETRREMVSELQQQAMPLHGKTIIYWSNSREAWWNSVGDYTPHTSIYNNRRWQQVWLKA